MRKILRTLLFLTLGGVFAATAIEVFLVPNAIIDGGILGISIMSAYVVNQHFHTAVSLGLFTFFMNIPFIFFALKKFGTFFVLSTFYAIGIMSLTIFLIEHQNKFSQATNEPMLACLFGGLILGLGVGLVLRNNGCLDGTEIMGIALTKKTGYSVGELIMFINVFIFIIAGFVYGPDNAMYSLLTYFIAYRVIDIVLEGLNESKSIWIISDFSREIGQHIIEQTGTSVTYLTAQGGYSGMTKEIVYCVTSRIGLIKLKEIVKSVDPAAFLSIVNVSEVEGSRIKKTKKFH